jgi:CRISPR/Cas system CMR-associated protein Cmr3 (group 5 of RAMP superfamily)
MKYCWERGCSFSINGVIAVGGKQKIVSLKEIDIIHTILWEAKNIDEIMGELKKHSLVKNQDIELNTKIDNEVLKADDILKSEIQMYLDELIDIGAVKKES